eukprot:358637-Chlamydomonas_euryale.AAC.1
MRMCGWACVGVGAYNVACLRSSSCSLPGPSVGGARIANGWGQLSSADGWMDVPGCSALQSWGAMRKDPVMARLFGTF